MHNAFRQTVALNEFESGIYFLKVKVGEQWLSEKIIKQ
jgi:hypothetical protein